MNNEFRSILSEEIGEFFELKVKDKAYYTVMHYRNALHDLDDYLAQTKVQSKELTKWLLDGWINTLQGKPATKQAKVCQIRMFCRYLRNIGIPAADPDLPIVRQEYIAYHFSDAELDLIYDWSDNLKDHYREMSSNRLFFLEFPVIFRILLCCGTRIGETIALKVRDIDFSSGCLCMRSNTKNGKQRVVPMHPDLTEILKCYCERMGILLNPDSVLFPREAGSEFTVRQKTVSYAFRTILIRLGIASADMKSGNAAMHERGPCIHCLRHAFAFRSFQQCESHGMPVNGLIPFLSFYLGHEKLDETEKYLKFSPDLQPGLTEEFESFSSSLFPEVLS